MQINGQFYVLMHPKSYAMRTLYATNFSLNLPPRIWDIKGTKQHVAMCGVCQHTYVPINAHVSNTNLP